MAEREPLFDYEPIVARPPLAWPDGLKVAFYVGLNIEHYPIGRPAIPIAPSTAALDPDPLNAGWRDYGPRVGVWRMMALFDELGIRPSVMLNSQVCEAYPEIVEAGVERDWCWLGHGQNNTMLQSLVDAPDERSYLEEMTATIARATGRAPRGWLGPALSESHQTVELLSQLGYGYVLDWTNDDQPYRLNVDDMLAVPYSIEVNDVTLCVGQNLSGADLEQLILDQIEQLLEDAEDGSGRVMALALHPFVVGQPFRHRYVARALRKVVELDGVWITTTDEIERHYREIRGNPS